jgi:hypothetical protein
MPTPTAPDPWSSSLVIASMAMMPVPMPKVVLVRSSEEIERDVRASASVSSTVERRPRHPPGTPASESPWAQLCAAAALPRG